MVLDLVVAATEPHIEELSQNQNPKAAGSREVSWKGFCPTSDEMLRLVRMIRLES